MNGVGANAALAVEMDPGALENSEWFVLVTMLVHLFMVPATKVEESFNVQAAHDILFRLPTNVTGWDHMSFPGVVPRTFLGPLYTCLLAFPFSLLMRVLFMDKVWHLFLVRCALGGSVTSALINLARCVKKHFGNESAVYFRIIVASQFHFMFYASRPLPNTFAMGFVLMVYQKLMDKEFASAVRWATACVFLFRCETILLFGPLFGYFIWNRELPLLGYDGAIMNGLRTAAKVIALSVVVDSYFWGRLVWPEGEVAYFNLILNKSHEYGVLPYLWYFYSALPRGLLLSLCFVIPGVLVDRRLNVIVFPCLIFVSLYSLLPHKELRFIMYVFPILAISAAVFCARMHINRDKSFWRRILYIGCISHIVANFLTTIFLLTVSSTNYPGADGMNFFQWQLRFDSNKQIDVHIDSTVAQTGVSQFYHLYDSWRYDKTENLTIPDLEKFDFLVLGTYGSNLKEEAKLYTQFTPMTFVPGFHKINYVQSTSFPFFYPKIVLKDKTVVLKNKKYH